LFFTDDIETAKLYGRDSRSDYKLYQCDLEFENPLILNSEEYDEFMQSISDWNEPIQQGYDSIICEEDPEYNDPFYYVALNPVKQVKNLKEIPKGLNEKLEELSDDIYATQSAYDILNLFKNKPKAYRVVYDKNIRYYFIGDALKYIHSNLISAAYHQGFYYDEFDMGSKDEIVTYLGDNLETQDILMLSFFPKDFGDIKAIDDERSSDWYTNKYTYDFGTIYVHEINEFEDFDFYHIAKPLSYEKLEIPENLDENLEKLENDYGEDIYATEYEYEVVNYCKETKSCLKILYANGWYFIGSAYSLIHNDLKNTAAKNGFFGEVEFKYGNAVVNTEDHDLFTFDVNTDEENARLEDEDKFVYEYPFGLFYTKRHIEDTPLYKYLGKPLNIRTLKSIYESLNSEIERYL